MKLFMERIRHEEEMVMDVAMAVTTDDNNDSNPPPSAFLVRRVESPWPLIP
jgi:hypothetical protein